MNRLAATIALFLPMVLVSATPISKFDRQLQNLQWTVIGNTSTVLPSTVVSTTPIATTTRGPSAAEVWQVGLGDICQITRFPLPSGESSRYLECVKPSDDDKEWPWTDKGIWVLKQCPPGLEFHLISHTCRSKRYIRRQQSICATNPTAQYCPQPQQPQYSVQPQQQMMCQCPPGINVCACPQTTVLQPQPMPQPQPQNPCPPISCPQQPCPQPPCPPQPCPQPPVTQQQNCPQPPQPPQPCPLAPQGAPSNAKEGDLCSWMLAPLAADPNNNKCFLQCVPAPGNAFCGRWVRMPCAPATIFDVNVQVCVHDPYNVPGPVPGWSASNSPTTQQQSSCNIGTNIGACNTNFQCPGQSVCQVSQQQSPQCQQAPQSCSMCCYTGGAAGGGGGGVGAMGGLGGNVPLGKK